MAFPILQQSLGQASQGVDPQAAEVRLALEIAPGLCGSQLPFGAQGRGEPQQVIEQVSGREARRRARQDAYWRRVRRRGRHAEELRGDGQGVARRGVYIIGVAGEMAETGFFESAHYLGVS